jgi:hypothetical protein
MGIGAPFTATFTGKQAEAGDPITIELLTSGFQGNFDNVRLSELFRCFCLASGY